MGLFDGFINKEERERKAREYQKKMLPFGMEQKEAALSLMRPLISCDIADANLFYYFLVAKEQFLDEKPLPDIKKYLKKKGSFKDHDTQLILTAVLLDGRAESLEAYPTLDDVKSFGAEYQTLMQTASKA